jgi:hypothetical protein
MKNSIYFYILGAIALIGIVFYSLQDAGSSPNYVQTLSEKRTEKDRFFSRHPQSPIKDKANFKGLLYFPPAQDFQVKAQVVLLQPPQTIGLQMSQGESEAYLKFAYLNFTLKGKQLKLLALKKTLREPILLVAFSDETSAKTTYGGGRYLEIPYRQGQKELLLDFNLAFQPYCAYNSDYVCPLPLAENHLTVAVEAGERYK